MAEPIGIASGVLALATFAFKTSVHLFQTIQSVRNQNKDVRELRDELQVLSAVLEPLEKRLQTDNIEGHNRYEFLQAPLYGCGQCCEELNNSLLGWTKNTKDGKNSLRDWLKLQYNGRAVEDIKDRLTCYKANLELALQVIALKDNTATREAIDELKTLAQDNETDLSEQLESVIESLVDVEESVRQVLERDKKLLQANLATCQTAEKAADNHPTVDLVFNNNTAVNARQLIGTDNSNLHGSMHASENRAEQSATQAIGMLSSGVIGRLFDQRGATQQTPVMVSVPQAIQIQSLNVSRNQQNLISGTGNENTVFERNSSKRVYSFESA